MKQNSEKADPEDDDRVRIELDYWFVEECEDATELNKDVARDLEGNGMVEQELLAVKERANTVRNRAVLLPRVRLALPVLFKFLSSG